MVNQLVSCLCPWLTLNLHPLCFVLRLSLNVSLVFIMFQCSTLVFPLCSKCNKACSTFAHLWRTQCHWFMWAFCYWIINLTKMSPCIVHCDVHVHQMFPVHDVGWMPRVWWLADVGGTCLFQAKSPDAVYALYSRNMCNHLGKALVLHSSTMYFMIYPLYTSIEAVHCTAGW